MVHTSLWSLKNRMLELSTSGSVGGAVGNPCFYPAADLAIESLCEGAFDFKVYRVQFGHTAQAARRLMRSPLERKEKY